MSERNDGGPAFPVAASEYGGNGPEWGMTLRDYFAAHAPAPSDLKSWRSHVARTFGYINEADCIAKWAYSYADAMLAERAK